MNGTPPIRVVVAEDDTLVREGIVRIVERAGLEVVGVAADAEDLVRKAGAHHPDLVITDIEMPPDMTDDGLRAALRIRAAHPEVGVMVLSQYLEGRYALELVGDRAEGVGYLLKERVGDPALFIDAERVLLNREPGSIGNPTALSCSHLTLAGTQTERHDR